MPKTTPNYMSVKNNSGFSLVFILLGVLVSLLVVGGVLLYVTPSLKNTVKIPRTTTNSKVLIGFSMGTLQEERWQKDKAEFLTKAKELGVSVDVESANNDSAKQISQIESLIIQKVDVLVIAPYDAASLTAVVAEAHKAGIKVISYDRLITDSPIDLYVSFDNEKVGKLEAQSVMDALSPKLNQGKKLKIAYIGGADTDNNSVLLKKGSFEVLHPYLDKGQIEVVFDKSTPDWKPENAYQNLKTYLDSTNGAVDGVICANDSTAFGSIKALQEHSLAGVVPVSGQDAELAAIQRIIQGTQTSTVYKSVNNLADAAVASAIKLVAGTPVSTNAQINNGLSDVPSLLLDPIGVTKDNIDATVIKDNYHTHAEVYGK